MTELAALIDRHCLKPICETPIRGLTLARTDASTKIQMAVPPPLFCVVATGRKRIRLGDEEFFYDPETYLVTSADLPVAGDVIDGPVLGVSLEIDLGILAELAVASKPSVAEVPVSRALAVSRLESDLLDSVIRLLRLLNQPEHISTLAPLALRELHYRLLLGAKGDMLRQLAAPSSQLSYIRRAIDFIRSRFDRPIRVEELADLAEMSAPSFHRHFRSVTGMSPIQYLKKIRLQEARRRLLAESATAASVAMEVGYESPSQFSREYRRMFGAPPAQEIRAIRQALAVVGEP
jgi:AraC-like DNA-binding protein